MKRKRCSFSADTHVTGGDKPERNIIQIFSNKSYVTDRNSCLCDSNSWLYILLIVEVRYSNFVLRDREGGSYLSDFESEKERKRERE